MKRALLIGVADEHPKQRFRPGPSLAAMEGLLKELGGWSITRVVGPDASREGILAALAQLEQRVGPDDACLFYFAGHGGVVEIHDLPAPLGGRPVFYLTAQRSRAQWSFEAILDVELSLCLARTDRVCGNVSAILDCCYSARTVRGPTWALRDSPDWLRELAEGIVDAECDELLSPTSHPGIVRLAASSALRMSFPEVLAEGHLGRLTQLFVEVVREARPHVDRLTWDALAHRVREQAIWRLGCEEQWVSLAGPRQRMVFEREEVALPRSVGFVPLEGGSGGWIRAGELQGVKVGDEWGLAALTLDAEDRPRWLSRMRVVATDLNRASLEPIEGEVSALPGTSALMLATKVRARVLVEGPVALSEALARSAWLCPSLAPAGAIGALSVDEHAIRVRSVDDVHASASFPANQRGQSAAIDRLEDWARARALLEVARGRVRGNAAISAELALSLSSSRVGELQRVHVGDRICLRIAVRGDWFVTAIHIDVGGCPTLLDPSESDGHEMLDRETWILGENPHRNLQGIELIWPIGHERDRTRRAVIVVLASRRPIQLGHLVRMSAVPVDRPRRRRVTKRGHLAQPRPRSGPELSHDWAATLVPYELDPRPRSVLEDPRAMTIRTPRKPTRSRSRTS